jgi:hypothetical protein
MSGKSQQFFEEFSDDEFESGSGDQPEDQRVTGGRKPGALTSARDARKRLEEYWDKKALDDELRDIDDWDETGD